VEGKSCHWVIGKLFYGPKGPSRSETMSQIIPSTKSKILEEFVVDLT
jgi:hypothetical protein